MNEILQLGMPFLYWLQGLGEWLTIPMAIFTFLGTEEFYLLFMPAVFWCFDAKLGFRLGVLLLSSAGINAMLKLIVGWPRPYWVREEVLALSSNSDFGFPSGHAQNAVALWGRFAAARSARWASAAFGLLILLISLSRIYLGMHFPVDVLGGWIIGGAILVLSLKLEPVIHRYFSEGPLVIRIGLLLAISLLILLLGSLAAGAQGEIPASWAELASARARQGEAIDPLSTGSLISSAATFFGLSTGGLLLFRGAGFSADGPVSARAIRLALGVLGVIVLFYGLRLLFPPQSTTLRFVRYSVVGFWAAYLAPTLFIRLGLASSNGNNED